MTTQEDTGSSGDGSSDDGGSSGDAGSNAASRRRHARGELYVNDLFLSFDRTCALAARETAERRWLDAFLLAAGALQLIEDHLHDDPASLGRAADFLHDTHRRPAERAAAVARGGVRAWVRATSALASVRRRSDQRDRLTHLTVALAGVVLGEVEVTDGVARALAVQARALANDALACPERLRRSLLRLPSCFRSFDQRPQDIEELMTRFAKRWPDRSRSVAVVGLRTSGSYLGPLAVAALDRHGYHDIHHLSVRPEAYFRADERDELLDVVKRGGVVVLVDDPPTTGGSLAAAARLVEQCGVASTSIVIALCLFGDEHEIPDRLSRYETVTVGWSDWHIHATLEPAALFDTVSGLLGESGDLVALEPIAGLGEDRRREHARRQFVMRWRERGRSEERRETLIVEGAGLGFFGRHGVAVAEAMTPRTPRVLGLAGGLLFMVVDDGVGMLGALSANDAGLVAAVGDYVAHRERALPAAADRSRSLLGRQPVWEVASNLLCRTLGRPGVALRMPLVDPIVRRVTAVDSPSIVDGRMGRDRWLTSPSGASSPLKLEFAEGAFSHRDLFCYDALFDLAGAASDLADDDRDRIDVNLRAHYEAASGKTVDDERWLIYSLVHQWDRARLGLVTQERSGRAMARDVQRYFAGLYLDGARVSGRGELVAIDVDGVLESAPLGFPATTRWGAMSLRALVAHGYEPVLATGRSIEEVRDRCQSYGLIGGVAEYGTVIYDARLDEAINLLGAADHDAIDALRHVIADVASGEIAGVEIDEDYTSCVRAFRPDRRGERVGLDETTTRTIVERVGQHRLTEVPGMAQTDFVPGAHTKANGLLTLAARLGADRSPYALAVGDGVADIAMFPLARLAAAPANASAEVRVSAACRVMRGAYQAGLAEAVAMLIGHWPGECARCSAPVLTPRARQLVELLSVQEAGSRGMPARLARLTVTSLAAHR